MFVQSIRPYYKYSPTLCALPLTTMMSSRALLIFINLFCFGVFFYQISVQISHHLDPGPDRLHTVLENKNLSQANVSLVFKVCYTPSYNMSVLSQAGYNNTMYYFLGKTNSSNGGFIGWVGKNKTLDVAGE